MDTNTRCSHSVGQSVIKRRSLVEMLRWWVNAFCVMSGSSMVRTPPVFVPFNAGLPSTTPSD